MAFGQKVPGRRGRPPKDPQARAAQQQRTYSQDVSEAGPSRSSPAFTSSSSVPAPLRADDELALTRAPNYSDASTFESMLDDMRARYERGVDERVAQVRL